MFIGDYIVIKYGRFRYLDGYPVIPSLRCGERVISGRRIHAGAASGQPVLDEGDEKGRIPIVFSCFLMFYIRIRMFDKDI